MFFFFFSSRRRHTIFDCDWSSDVCSSDLPAADRQQAGRGARPRARSGASRRPCVAGDRRRLMLLTLIEDSADELSQQAYGFARGTGEEVAVVAIDGSAPYAPAAWAQTIVELISGRSPSAVIAPGTDRGNEVLAHVAAKLDQPMAANCVSVTPGDPITLTRVRWGG